MKNSTSMAEIGEESFLSFLGLDQRLKSRPSCLKTATQLTGHTTTTTTTTFLGTTAPKQDTVGLQLELTSSPRGSIMRGKDRASVAHRAATTKEKAPAHLISLRGLRIGHRGNERRRRRRRRSARPKGIADAAVGLDGSERTAEKGVRPERDGRGQ